MPLKLARKEVAEKYEAAFDNDQEVIIQGLYRGPLSKITLSAANRMMRTKTNL